MCDEQIDRSKWRKGNVLIAGKPSTPSEVRLYYIDRAPDSKVDGGTILLIHGFPETSHQWRHVINPLAEAGYRVLAPDYRGAGYSSKPRDLEGYSKRAMAQDMVDLLDKVDVKGKVHVVGHDIGGMVAHSFASQHPERTQSVMWGECPQPGTEGYDTSVSSDLAFHFLFHRQQDLPEALVQGRERMYLMHFYTRFSHNSAIWDPEAVDFYVQQFSQAGAMRCGMDTYRNFEVDKRDNLECVEKVGKCQVPAAAFVGQCSHLRPGIEDQFKEFYEAFEVLEVANSGHWVAEENPDDCASKILGFVGKHKV